jgi:hypothetical protein
MNFRKPTDYLGLEKKFSQIHGLSLGKILKNLPRPRKEILKNTWVSERNSEEHLGLGEKFEEYLGLGEKFEEYLGLGEKLEEYLGLERNLKNTWASERNLKNTWASERNWKNTWAWREI